MVRAILDGTKTQTRRVITPQLDPAWGVTSAGVLSSHTVHDGEWWWLSGDPKDFETLGVCGDPFRCPYGVPGDRLWVRESWCATLDGWPVFRPVGPDCKVWYKANNDRPTWAEQRWKPSIHMPRWASRITLEVTRVWVERVREIKDNDALAEGVEMVDGPKPPKYGVPGLAPTFRHYQNSVFNSGRGVGVRHSFQTLWDSINANKGHGWATNPWVWCVEFKRTENNKEKDDE